MLRSAILGLARRYLLEKEKPFGKNEFASTTRKQIIRAIEYNVDNPHLIYQASVGKGNWASVPWIAVFNPESTNSATSGVYVVYLFSVDMKYLYLCQGQGVTTIKKEFGAKGQVQELRRRADLIRSRVPEHTRKFKSGDISLGGDTPLAREYDAAVAYSTCYRLDELPNDNVLRSDLLEMVRLYNLLIARGGVADLFAENVGLDEELSDKVSVSERRKYVRHSTIERNSRASKLAKLAHGLTCQGCGLNFEDIYGEIGEGYIEAHHLRPLHTLLEGETVDMGIKEDFAVLCSNCHAMVHRASPMLTSPLNKCVFERNRTFKR